MEKYIKKNRGLVSEVYNEEALEYLKGNMAIGHNRYATAGSDSVLDAQPVYAKSINLEKFQLFIMEIL